MHLRTQVLFGMIVLAAVVAGLLFGVVAPRALRTFDEIEDTQVAHDITRVRNAVDAELAGLESTADDWGAWNDTAAFVRGEAPDYGDENVVPAIMQNLRLGFMVFFDRSGRVVLARGYDPLAKTMKDLGPGALAGVERARAALSPEGTSEGYSETVNLDGMFAFVAFHPILNSQHEVPIWGTVAIGRLLDAAEVSDLAGRVDLPLVLEPLPSPNVPAPIAASLASGATSGASRDSADRASGFALLVPGSEGGAVLRFTVPRTTSLAGVRMLRTLVGTLLTALLVLAGAFLVFLNTRVLSRTARLAHDVRRIAASPDPTARVEARGRDELAELGTHINGMLASIETSRAALERSEERYHNLFESSRDPIYITAEDGRFIDVNQAFLELFQFTKDEIMGMAAGDLYVRPEDRDAFRAAIREKGFVTGYPVTLRKKDDTHVRCLLTTIVDAQPVGGLVYQGIIRDVTELLRQQEELTYLATHDPLTGLLTRGALDDVMRLEIARAMRNLERLAVFYLDLDKFKEVNDMHGHAAGDRVLKEVSVRLREALRASDTLARLGGDEFVALLPGIETPHDAEIAAEKILQAIREAFRVNNHQRRLSVSIGIALYPDDGDTATHLLQKADAAMYSVKGRGRDGWQRFHSGSLPPSQS